MYNIKYLNIFTLIITLLWILILVTSLFYNITRINEKHHTLVLEKARNSIEKDLLFREWVASHGGVYIFPTNETPPNKYLSQVKDRDLTTTDGRVLTLMNPAYTLREIMNKFIGLYGEKSHITSLKVLNPKNKADKWETKVLKKLDKKIDKEIYEIVYHNNIEQFRYMKALVTKQDCLKCHSHQGYKVGDIRGGISVTIPMKKYNNNKILERKYLILTHLLLLIIGLFVIFIIFRLIKKFILKEKILQNEIKKKEEIATYQAKMASLGEMIGNIAHQWRQPLSVISTSASGLKVQNEFAQLDDETLNKSVKAIVDTCQYLSQTIDDFKNFINTDKEKNKFLVNENINKNLKILEGTLKAHDINVILDLEKEIIINNYQNELTQAFINIINNSKDALVENNIKNKLIFISLKKNKNKDKVKIKIKDNANGIDPQIIYKIFDPYFTTKHKSQGTGLGLYMTYNIINESMEGIITVKNVYYEHDNEAYKGVQFTIELPLT